MYTFKARSIRYDNIKSGSNTGIERTIAGGAVPPQFTSKWGNNENIALGLVYGADENLVKVATNLLTKENLTPPAHSLLMADAPPPEDDDTEPETTSRPRKARKK